MLSTCQIDAELAKLLKIAVLMHDVRRDEMVGHAEASAKFFDKLEIKGLSKEEKKDICFAICNHSRGRRTSAGPAARKDVLLSLLCVVDHMDAMGLTDLLRTIEWQQSMEYRMGVFGKIPARSMRRVFENGKYAAAVDGEPLKEDSYLGHLMFNYLVMKNIVEPVREMLSDAFLERTGEKEMRKLIEQMLELYEENEKNFNGETMSF